MRNEVIIELTEKIFRDCSDNTVHLPDEDCDVPDFFLWIIVVVTLEG